MDNKNNKVFNTIENTVNRMAADRLTAAQGTMYSGIKRSVRQCLEYFQTAMFPNFTDKDFSTCMQCRTQSCRNATQSERMTLAFRKAAEKLIEVLSCFIDEEKAVEVTEKLIERMPAVKQTLETDIQAAYEGDPAAKNTDEIILAYPGFTAISIFRIAHELYLMNIPTVPRMMTEYAHETTGIDINPGADIGQSFFIDHGTGVVIGETTVIGNHVKIYQNVTLGARSFELTPDGTPVKGIKRHPNIGNNVVIYAGATILGGDTFIGDNCIIGGNVWLTHSVPSDSTVTQNSESRVRF